MTIQDNTGRISWGTAKTFEHIPTQFKFRAEGDGAFEPLITDQFSSTAPIVESLEDRRFRAFLKKEHALQTPESLGKTLEQRKEALNEVVVGTLGEGWQVADYNAPGNGVARVTTLELNDNGNRQEIYIDRYGRQPELRLSSATYLEGWEVRQSLVGELSEGAIDAAKALEDVAFKR